MRIVEYIGVDGMKTSDANHIRYETPHPGDVVIWDKNSPYPFNKDTYGRIDRTNYLDEKGTTHICCEPGSCYLSDGYVSISGGPFETVTKSKGLKLVPTYALKSVDFWNFCELGAGGGMGAHFSLERPVFKLVIDKDIFK